MRASSLVLLQFKFSYRVSHGLITVAPRQFANGTDALYIAMVALKVKPGDEVITTAHSWISTSAMITHAGATAVFCDTDAQTFTIDPADAKDFDDAISFRVLKNDMYEIGVHIACPAVAIPRGAMRIPVVTMG